MLSMGKIFINITSDKPLNEKGMDAYSEQLNYLKQVWDEESYGLERVFRLVLCLAQFLYPILFIRNISGKWGSRARRLAVEIYIVFKFLFPLAAMVSGWYNHTWVVCLTAYLLSETLVHVLHLVFLSDIHSSIISYRRSLLLLFFHYAEVAFDFAVFYMAFNVLSQPATLVKALYFSFVTATTVGFGDVVARNSAGQILVVAQLMVCSMFIVVFINHFAQEKQENN